jgi:hypothetical protein
MLFMDGERRAWTLELQGPERGIEGSFREAT